MSDHNQSNELTEFGALDAVRRLEQRMFRVGSFNAPEVVAHIVQAALVCDVRDLQIVTDRDWYLISSDTDWLTEDGVDVASEAFDRILSFRRGGDNSMRPEVLLSAFASDVLTLASGVITEIRSSEAQRPDLAEYEGAARVVAFRV